MSKKQQTPPAKIAILIDGGFFVKRFNALYNRDRSMTGVQVAEAMYNMAMSHISENDTLYRIFYYDCEPLSKKVHHPITKRAIDYSKSPEYKFRKELFESLKHKRKVALRIGTLKDNNNWHIHAGRVKELLSGKLQLSELKEDDVYLEIRQKGIDMKIGVDISSLALKQFVDRIVLFAGDSDFVPAAKMARREGVDFILDPMLANVEPQLFEHIDGLRNSHPTPRKKPEQA